MKRRRKLRVPLNGWRDVPYLTWKNKVYLGKYVKKDVKKRAKKAGLKPLNAAQLRKLRVSMQTINWIIEEGRWYDTVRY